MKAASLFFILLQSASATRRLRSHRKLVQSTDPTIRIDQEYIVIFDDQVDVVAKMTSLLEGLDGNSEILFTYTDDLKGLSLKMLPDASLWNILEDEDVQFVEENQIVKAFGEQREPPWGLDRLDEISLPLDNNYHYEYTGKGVTVFVVDTGIRTTHVEFGGRASCGYTAFAFLGDNCQDGEGHGTHVAGVIGGETYGVAKEADLRTIKVLTREGAGDTAGVLSGIDYMVSYKKQNPNTPMVANMSLGGAPSRALDRAVQNAIKEGIVFVVAAGNDGTNWCIASPAGVEEAITVGATRSNDARASFSNYGPCLDIFAPGENINSAVAFSDTATYPLDGTSMAAPFVSGVAALYLEANPTWTPAMVWDAMRNDAINGAIRKVGSNTPNLLVSTRGLKNAGGGEFPDPAPSPTQPSPGPPTPDQCMEFLSSCQQNSECCSNLCWSWFGRCW